MKVIDVTRTISPQMPMYPGEEPPVFRERVQDSYTITDLQLTTHTGTHVDAPSHTLFGGSTIDTIPLSHLIGPCRVLDMRKASSPIQPQEILPRLERAQRILFRTDASEQEFFGTRYPALSMEAVTLLIEQSVVCVGIDSPSVESYDGDGSIHRALLSQGVAILEFLDLSQIEEGNYWMAALPLPLKGLDGSPARVVLCNMEEFSREFDT
jgi:arylformamidase